jgi:hypothetical protein
MRKFDFYDIYIYIRGLSVKFMDRSSEKEGLQEKKTVTPEKVRN